jgi:glutathione S-transferase
MLTLLTFPAGFNQFSLSPFCVKAAYLLQVSGQPWKRQDLKDPRKMPYQKLPVLKAGQRQIGDSDNIRIWLKSQGADFDSGLSDVQKAMSRALIRMAEEHLYFHLVMDRWANDHVWPTIRDIYFDEIPGLLRKPVTNGLRKSLLKGLNAHGIARFSETERAARLEADLLAIRSILTQSPFLFGDRPSAADLSIAPMLDAMRVTPVRTALVKRVANDPVLTEYLDRMTQAIPLP